MTELSVKFLGILTLIIWKDVTTCCLHFSKQQCLSLSTFLFGTTLASLGQLSAVRMFDIHAIFVPFKFYPWTFQEEPKTTPARKLAAKAAIVPETPAQGSKPSPKKIVTPKKDNKDVGIYYCANLPSLCPWLQITKRFSIKKTLSGHPSSFLQLNPIQFPISPNYQSKNRKKASSHGKLKSIQVFIRLVVLISEKKIPLVNDTM